MCVCVRTACGEDFVIESSDKSYGNRNGIIKYYWRRHSLDLSRDTRSGDISQRAHSVLESGEGHMHGYPRQPVLVLAPWSSGSPSFPQKIKKPKTERGKNCLSSHPRPLASSRAYLFTFSKRATTQAGFSDVLKDGVSGGDGVGGGAVVGRGARHPTPARWGELERERERRRRVGGGRGRVPTKLLRIRPPREVVLLCPPARMGGPRLSLTNNFMVWCEENGELGPKDFTFSSHVKVPWKCGKCQREWVASINNRTRSENPRGCWKCSGKDRQGSGAGYIVEGLRLCAASGDLDPGNPGWRDERELTIVRARERQLFLLQFYMLCPR
jgi:hypothetical protein